MRLRLQRFRELRRLSNSHIQTLIPIQSTSRSAWMAVGGSFAGSEASPPSRLCMKLQLGKSVWKEFSTNEAREASGVLGLGKRSFIALHETKKRQKRQKGQGYT